MGKTLAACILAVVLVAGCGSGGGGGGGADTTRCSPAPSTLLAAISQGLTVSGGGLGAGYVVKSNDFSKVWMVAAEINGPGMEGAGDIGVWATNDPSGGGMIFAVDGMAKEFSDWADGSTTDAKLSLSDDGVSAAKALAGK
jgi:hypothetical protein